MADNIAGAWLAESTVKSFSRDLLHISPMDPRYEQVEKWIRQSGMRPKIQSMLDLAMTKPEFSRRAHRWDTDGMLLGVGNGVIDLRTGSLRPHAQDDYLTKKLQVAYDERAECPLWEKFIAQATCGDVELAEYLQRCVGYWLTGSTEEHAMFILVGGGANGKSTFLEVVRAMLGEFAKQVETAALFARDNQGIPNALARLHSARLAVATESDAGKRLDEGFVKSVTGGDTVTARFLYKEFFDFAPQFKVVLGTNHLPQVQGRDEGIWRRLHVVPFRLTVPKGERDHRLKERLLAELPGILAWAVEGCQAWQKEGLTAPVAVLDAVAKHRHQQEPLAEFVADCLVDDPAARTSSAGLYASYRYWWEEQGSGLMSAGERQTAGLQPLSKRLFGEVLTERGYSPYKSGNVRGWAGVRVRQPAEG